MKNTPWKLLDNNASWIIRAVVLVIRWSFIDNFSGRTRRRSSSLAITRVADLAFIRPRTRTPSSRTTRSWNEVVVGGVVDAGATGLTRGGNAEIGVMRMESAMKRCGRGDRIRKHERRRHRKTRSHRPRSESAAATGTEKSESGRKRRIRKRGGESGGKGKTPNQIEKSHRRPRLFQETPEKELKYRGGNTAAKREGEKQ